MHTQSISAKPEATPNKGIMLLRVEGGCLTLRSEGVSRPVLQHLNLELRQGEHTAIMGGNGAGKSTLLRLLRGEAWLDPQGGHICWHTPQGIEDAALAGRQMAALVSAATQEQYTRQGWDCSGMDILLTAFTDSPLLYSQPQSGQREAALRMAANLRCKGLMARPVNTLSQGQMRLLLLARALLRRPTLLLLDEFLDGLDSATRAHVLQVLAEHASKPQDAHAMTMVFTAHRQEGIPPWVQRRLYLHEGQLHQTPPPRPQRPKEQRSPAAWQMPKEAISDDHAAEQQTTGQQDSPPLLTLERATVYLDRQAVLHDITWRMHKGEHWLIYGGNGAGKSTLLRLLAGDEYPAAGGSISRHLPRHGGHITDLESIRRGIRLVSDREQALYSYNLSALDLVLSGFDNVTGQYRTYSKSEEAQALAWMRQLNVEELATCRMRALSTGQLRRLLLARALVGGPEILLLDEPCSGLDAQGRGEFLELLQDLSAHVHLILISHHDEDHIAALNRRAKMEAGRLYIEESAD